MVYEKSSHTSKREKKRGLMVLVHLAITLVKQNHVLD